MSWGGLQRNGLDVARLEADGRFLCSPGIQPSQERDGPLQSLLIEAVRSRRPVWASFNWTKPVALETMLRQQVELGALADAAQLVVKTAAVQRVADWSVTTRQQASAFPRSMVTMAPDGLTLSRGVPLPAL